MFDKVKAMYKKFGFENTTGPTVLDTEDYRFRVKTMFEELFEYMEEVFECGEWTKHTKQSLFYNIDRMHFRADTKDTLEHQFDALIDLVIFAMGTAERQGFPFEEGFNVVMEANMQKEKGVVSKRNYGLDLIKPEGWEAPDLKPLVEPHNVLSFNEPIEIYNTYQHTPENFKDQYEGTWENERVTGLIVIDGADATGKTTLANKFASEFNGIVIHHTWSVELQNRMDKYLIKSLETAIMLSKNQLVIIDRLWLSELIYSQIYREETQYHGLHEKLDNMVSEAGGFNIICSPPDIESHRNLFREMAETRGEMYEYDAGIVQLFWAAMHNASVKAFTYTPNCLKHPLTGRCDYASYCFAFPKDKDIVTNTIFYLEESKNV